MQRLKPFFQYFGSKNRLALRYPAPRHDTIIEPFAGSAAYSLCYPDRQIVLCDASPKIRAIWNWLICADPEEIMALPVAFERISELTVRDEAKWLMGFWVQGAVGRACNVRSSWSSQQGVGVKYWNEKTKERIASQVGYIRHWQVSDAPSFECLPDSRATWFVDPPYQVKGTTYEYGSANIDFASLGVWCKSRQGQVIVCENDGADWLPFRAFRTVAASTRKTKEGRVSREVIWTNDGES